ncbi:hypothetical protein C8J56DRAFT_889477 [Mycena floridula]|nr:hypothetical protein C8J56DRAFT_889477 [Mycena floridula]
MNGSGTWANEIALSKKLSAPVRLIHSPLGIAKVIQLLAGRLTQRVIGGSCYRESKIRTYFTSMADRSSKDELCIAQEQMKVLDHCAFMPRSGQKNLVLSSIPGACHALNDSLNDGLEKSENSGVYPKVNGSKPVHFSPQNKRIKEGFLVYHSGGTLTDLSDLPPSSDISGKLWLENCHVGPALRDRNGNQWHREYPELIHETLEIHHLQALLGECTLI